MCRFNFSHLLAKLINLSFSTGIVLHYFKKAKLIPIYKSGANTDFSNYRPISILPVVSKLLERSVYDHLVLFLSNNNMITQCQSGFRNLHSTITALTKLHNDLLASLNRRCSTGVACLDFRKAFDTVDHSILLNKMKLFGISAPPHKWLHSYLSNRSQSVNFNGVISTPMPVTVGIPQSSIWGHFFSSFLEMIFLQLYPILMLISLMTIHSCHILMITLILSTIT